MFRNMLIPVISILIFYSGSSFAQEDSVFYFGAFLNQVRRIDSIAANVDSEADSIKQSIGFNTLIGFSGPPSVLEDMGTDRGFYTMPSMNRGDPATVRNVNKCLWANYAKVEAEIDTFSIGFWHTGTVNNGFVYGPTETEGDTAIFLDSLWYRHQTNAELEEFFYNLQVNVDKDTFSVSVGDTIGFLRILSGYYWQTPPNSDHIRTYYITLNDSAYTTEINFVPPLYPLAPKGVDYIQVATLQRCILGVDYFKVYNQYGYNLVEDPEFTAYVDTIAQFAADNTESGNVKYWYIHEEPRFTQWEPHNTVNTALVQEPNSSPEVSVFSYYVGQKSPRDFIYRADPEIMMADIYPLGGGQCMIVTTYDTTWTVLDVDTLCNEKTQYTGDHSESTVHGLQFALDNSYISLLDSIRAACGSSLDMWVLAQAFGERYFGVDTVEIENGYKVTEWVPENWYTWRMPTRSELSAMTFMAMCYDIKGLQYFRYDSRHSDNNIYIGITDSLIFDRYDLWDYLSDYISPYVKAFGETLLSLEYDTSYSVNPTRSPPSNAAVASAYASSEIPHPDTGWLHIGEFNDNDTLYIMLVNRACSKVINDTIPAPPQHVRLDLKPSAVGSNYAYIINLADTAYYDTSTSTWVGIPDTTYSANLGGTIPFTTVLGPGEGRLFKIVGIARIALKDTLAEPGFSYQGSIKINGDVIIPSGSTFKVKGPANFRIAQCDSSAHGGLDNTLVEIVCDGRMSFIGTENDSIYFRELYDCESGLPLETVDPGDWYGIRDKSDDYDTLSYCFIRFAYNGYSGEATSNAIIRHCRISNSENSGIRLVNACRDTLNVDSCLISDNGSHGIEATISCLIADGNTITKNTSSGVYIVENGTIPCGDLDYRLANNTITQGDDYSTQKGVNVIGRWDSNPSVVFEGNMIEDFSSSGVHLYRVKVGDWDSETGTRFIGYNKIESNSTYGLWCQYSSPAIYTEGDCASYNSFSYNSGYGIYCSSLSNPKIRKTKLLDNGRSNLTCVGLSAPVLGDTSSFNGCNDFRTVGYDIKVGGLTIIKAQMNYWGEITPDTLDFYPSHNSVLYKPYRSRPCIPSGKIEGTELEIPDQFALYQNYPNPFNPATSISFDLPEASYVKILIYNILGQRVRILTDEYCEPGHHVIVWDSRDRYGNEVASGIYFYLLEASQFADVRKMLILR